MRLAGFTHPIRFYLVDATDDETPEDTTSVTLANIVVKVCEPGASSFTTITTGAGTDITELGNGFYEIDVASTYWACETGHPTGELVFTAEESSVTNVFANIYPFWDPDEAGAWNSDDEREAAADVVLLRDFGDVRASTYATTLSLPTTGSTPDDEWRNRLLGTSIRATHPWEVSGTTYKQYLSDFAATPTTEELYNLTISDTDATAALVTEMS